ncbi:protein cornichon homolog 4-like isoform X2 [Nicotiana tabacum]|uniref:Protein cornichon homolog 4-like n=1 Tax=Nicotiana tabacum TaxID=4097 RepID=A0A1S4DMF2_TOBAC|nr:protein cornichon homolog 4-like [Nicotiana tomentosiformis]XP_016514583.1 PREDICTED: protein cornichon homolog 4-like [Nicotiana tabacum]XP_018627434.1 protein cornichon homolog 4-like [Nicotiana tomentosiformis]
MIGDLLSWLLAFFLVVAVLAAVLYQVMCLADLENDYVNPYDSASEINELVVPEFVLQGALCFVHLAMGHWFMCLICLPYLYYDVKVYTDRRHLLDVTEIFNQLPWEKKIRLYKLGYLGILLVFSIISMVWSIVSE